MSFTRFNPATDITERFGDQLVLDPSQKILIRGVGFGYEAEFETIRDNPTIFPFFYHLNTPVRNNYQYVHFLARLYQLFPKTVRYLRSLYKGDNLRFYRDFYNNNLSYFEKDMLYTAEGINRHGLEMLLNCVKDFSEPWLPQIKALLRFEFNANQISQASPGTTIQEIYDFSYVDYKMKLPIEMYSDGKTEILMKNKDGKFAMQVLQLL
jgi:hypothetical protein